MDLLETIAELSHEFGGPEYVLGGGGNSSAKDDATLWVKPSGVTLLDLRPGDFVAMDRARIAELYTATPPADPAAREALVKDLMLAARRSGATGRPSVEAPLHNVFAERFVVHTHPALVNGLTCARGGAAACARLFPEALWVPYVDPGYTLSIETRRALQRCAEQRGRAPAVVLLENHGVFVAGEDPETVRAAYARLLDALRAEYRAARLDLDLPPPAPPTEKADAGTRALLRELLGPAEAAHIASSGLFPPPRGPLSPDHIVYAKSYLHIGPISADSIARFRAEHGYTPRVFATDAGVWAVGATAKEAELALAFARDGARVQRLAQAFDGPQYLTERARAFIENWEVESYRRQVSITPPK